MIIKYRPFGAHEMPVPVGEDILGPGPLWTPEWTWVDNVQRIQCMGQSSGSPAAECFSFCHEVSTASECRDELTVYWVHRVDERLPMYLALGQYTEAYLMTDQGGTIERLKGINATV